MHEHARAAVPPPAPEPLPERHLAQRDGAAPGQQARGLRPAPRGRRPPPAGLPAAARDGISGTGTPLEGGLRARMEAAFSQDLSAVRVHSDPAAHRAALALHARAFAVGDHIVLGPGNGQGDTELVGHELAHVVQHRPVPGGAAGPATGGPSGSGPFEQEATAAGARASAGQAVAVAAPGGAPAVQLDRLTFGAGSTQVVVENGVVTVNGTKIPATAGSDGRLWFRNREIVLDRSGVLRYRDRYTVCFSCNPDYYEGPRWTAKAGTALPELEGTFYDTAARRWTLRREPVVTTAVVQPPGGAAAGAPPGPVNPALQSRVERAAAAREQFEARVNQAMAEGRRTRPDAERIVRQRLREGLGRSGLGEFESGQTYAVVEEELEPGLTRRTTTGAVHGGEVPTVQVPSTELKTRLGELNRRLGETFRFNEQTLNHAEVRAIVRTPTATTFYVNRDMCSSCERFFLLEARAQGREITVVAPSSTKVFTPDLQIVEYRPGVVYERRAAISRAEGVSTLELGDQPAVTHSVRPVQRTTPVSESELPPSERPLARPAASGDTARAGGTAAAEAEGAGGSAARATPAEPGTGTAPRAAVPEPATKKPTPPEAPGPRGAARPGSVELPGVARPGAAGPRGSAVAEAAESGLGRTAARAGAGGIRRFALGAAGSLAEAALGVALL
ncbi:MAG TPA: DUF4157 domain-containing protein, partial [Kineosporiaceae bacterium]